MKLLLGCGGQKIEGWIGVDIEPSVKPDILDNIITLTTIENNSVDSIKSVHSLEHLSYKNALIALKNWHRILKKNGELSIEIPDFKKAFDMVLSTNDKERYYGVNGVFGDVNTNNMYLTHKFGWTYQTLTSTLKKIGFGNFSKVKPERINQCFLEGFDRDMRIISIKR